MHAAHEGVCDPRVKPASANAGDAGLRLQMIIFTFGLSVVTEVHVESKSLLLQICFF